MAFDTVVDRRYGVLVARTTRQRKTIRQTADARHLGRILLGRRHDEQVDVVVGMRTGLTTARATITDHDQDSADSLGQGTRIKPTHLKPQGYTLAVADNQRKILDLLNRQILLQTRDADWDAIVDRFLQSDRNQK